MLSVYLRDIICVTKRELVTVKHNKDNSVACVFIYYGKSVHITTIRGGV